MAQRICATCGGPIPEGKRSDAVTCSKTCSSAYARQSGPPCSVEGCDKPHRARGLCATHYNQRLQPDRHKKIETTCVVCGAAVMKERSARRAVCSQECRTALRWGEDYVSKPEARRRALLPVPAAPSCEVPPRHPARQLAQEVGRWWGYVVSVRCEWCGGWGLVVMPSNSPSRNDPRFCSNECGKAAGKAKTRRRLRSVYVEPTHWRKVAKRDGLRCYICNRQTRPGDFKWVVGRDGRKAFQAGPRYPTLDHVVALVGGGEHAMDNARLSCRDCNSHKSDKSVDVQLLLTA